MRAIWRLFTGFFRVIWRTLNFIREFILNLFVLLVICIIGLFYFQSQPKNVEQEKGALLVDLSGVIVDTPKVNSHLGALSKSLLGSSDSRMQETSLFDVVETLRQAKKDPKITGIVLTLNDFIGADQPSLSYIGKALKEFRDAGKPIYAIGDSYSQSQYYLASFANKIYLSPQGAVEQRGLATNGLYFKSMLDKLKVSTHIFRVGTYKSAVEPYLRDSMSPEAYAADSRWLGGLWSNYTETVAKNRKSTPDKLYPDAKEMIAKLTASDGNMAHYALKNNLVDSLVTRADVEKLMVKQFGWDSATQSFNNISIYDYSPQPEVTQPDGDKIAVIFANGAIIDGEQTPGMVGADSTAEEIRLARLDPFVKAVVFRVNSPGGSVTASETIRDELLALRKTGKPLVVSMGGVAASGGYWVSTPANYIIASPSTLTGSIGIFGMVSTFENSLDYIGVHTDGVATSPLADISPTKQLPEEFSQLMQMSIESGYKRFLSIVSESRHKTPEQIDSIAQGRVWLGSDAKDNGLVDQLGDFDDAVKKAAELAKVKDYQLDWYLTEPSLFDSLFNELSASVVASLPESLQVLMPSPLIEMAKALKQQPGVFSELNDPQNRYAICFSCSNIR